MNMIHKIKLLQKSSILHNWLRKQIIDYHLKIRLSARVPTHNKDKLHKDNIGKRQQATKLLTFQDLWKWIFFLIDKFEVFTNVTQIRPPICYKNHKMS